MEKKLIVGIFVMMLGFTLFLFGLISFNTEKEKWISKQASVVKINIKENEKNEKKAEIFYKYDINDTVFNKTLLIENNVDETVEKYREKNKIDILYNKDNISESVMELPEIGMNYIIIGMVFVFIGFGTSFYDFQPPNKLLKNK